MYFWDYKYRNVHIFQKIYLQEFFLLKIYRLCDKLLVIRRRKDEEKIIICYDADFSVVFIFI